MKAKLSLSIIFLVGLFSCEKEKSLPVACFDADRDSSTNLIYFSNCSENTTSYLWDFGDGDTSTEDNPQHSFETDPPYTVTLIAYGEITSDTLALVFLYDEIVVRKPNIYIYPQEEMDLCVKIDFPLGGEVIKSEPEYNNKWCVHVNTDGIIENQYYYLFYESSQPNIFQYKEGWCVKQEDLESFFQNNMASWNFSQQEIKDFTAYWVPLLKDSEFYCIYPQTNDILDQIIALHFLEQPDHIGRLFYGVIESDEFIEMKAPEITPIIRTGFYVTEWGVFLE